MSILKNLEVAENTNFVVLKNTKTITQGDIDNDAAWKMVSDEYKTCQDSDWVTKASVSLVNSIIYQRRVVFVLTRESLRLLLKNDQNWNPPLGLKNTNYKTFLRRIFAGLVEKVEETAVAKTGRYVMIMKVVHPEILKYLQVDASAQLNEAREFTNLEKVTSKPRTQLLTQKEEFVIWSRVIEKHPKQWEIAEKMEDDPKQYQKSGKIKKALFEREMSNYMKERNSHGNS